MKFSPESLTKARIERGWSMYQLSKESGVSTSTIHDSENGKYVPKPETVERLAVHLKKPALYFFDPSFRENEKKRPKAVNQ